MKMAHLPKRERGRDSAVALFVRVRNVCACSFHASVRGERGLAEPLPLWSARVDLAARHLWRPASDASPCGPSRVAASASQATFTRHATQSHSRHRQAPPRSLEASCGAITKTPPLRFRALSDDRQAGQLHDVPGVRQTAAVGRRPLPSANRPLRSHRSPQAASRMVNRRNDLVTTLAPSRRRAQYCSIAVPAH